MNCWWFLKNLNHCLKNVYQKPLSFLELLYKKKEKNPNDFPIVDSYFFHNFLDVFIVRNRVIWLSECLFRETYSIKDFTFDPHIAYQSFKLTAELHLTKKQILFILENLKLIKKSYNNISKTLSIPYSKPKIVKGYNHLNLLLPKPNRRNLYPFWVLRICWHRKIYRKSYNTAPTFSAWHTAV